LIHLKINELVVSHKTANNDVIHAEEKTEQEIIELLKEHKQQIEQIESIKNIKQETKQGDTSLK
jgi:low affinity Fe/Cu permease